MNLHLTPCALKCSCSLGDQINFLTSKAADLNVLALSDMIEPGRPRHTLKRRNARMNESTLGESAISK